VDLVEAGMGSGWCAFRLRLSVAPERLLEKTVTLFDLVTQEPFYQSVCSVILAESELILSTLEEIQLADPTTLQSIDQLKGCTTVFSEFIEAEGVGAFVSRAFAYVVGRPADEAGLAGYVAALRSAALSPYEVLHALSESEEFRRAPNMLIAPTEPGFPFRRS
jgi:hypothetical protein